jgi:hypothetical protein
MPAKVGWALRFNVANHSDNEVCLYLKDKYAKSGDTDRGNNLTIYYGPISHLLYIQGEPSPKRD